MKTSLVDADSLLAIDVGAVTTRALLFDTVEGRYRFIAGGAAASTTNAPLNDAGEGVRRAIDDLQAITGRQLVGMDEALILPSGMDGSGVDTFVATVSAGPPMKAVAVGLLETVSLDSVRNLLNTTYAQVLDSMSLTDRRDQAAKIDAILGVRPEVVVVSGGTDNGASRSVLKRLRSLAMALDLLPAGQRPELLFAGNQNLIPQIQPLLGELSQLHLAPNVRPNLETEQLGPAQGKLNEIFCQVRSRQLLGIQELLSWSGGHLAPTAAAFGRVIQFLSDLYGTDRGILGVDLGASSTVMGTAVWGELGMRVFPNLGMGEGLQGLFDRQLFTEIMPWLLIETSEDYVLDYMYNKIHRPASLPVTAQDMAIEQAIARVVIQAALKQTRSRFPKQIRILHPALLPEMVMVLAGGSVLAKAPTPGQSLMMLLDALQPVSISTFIVDHNNLTPALGSASLINPVLTVQVLESNSYFSLGTVISPVGKSQPGSPVFRVEMVNENRAVSKFEVASGQIASLPLPVGQSASLILQPLQRYNIGRGPGRPDKVSVVGGALGVVVDARGRPLALPANPEERMKRMRRWLAHLGG